MIAKTNEKGRFSGNKIEREKWANFLYSVLEFAVKLIPHSRNGPIFYTPF